MTERGLRIYKSLQLTGRWNSEIEELIKELWEEARVGYCKIEDKKEISKQLKIKPLEFKDNIAYTPVGTYILFDYGDDKPVKWYTKQCSYDSSSREEAIESANEHYQSMVNNIMEQCLISEE